MSAFEKSKMILGYILVGYALIGMLVLTSWQFGTASFQFENNTFGWGYAAQGGGASAMGGLLYGFYAIAGAILLSSVKKN